MILRTGDAEAEVWLEASGGRSYCLCVTSRRGRPDRSPTYFWWVEVWWDDGGEDASAVGPRQKADTFNEAMRRARREAARLEGGG